MALYLRFGQELAKVGVKNSAIFGRPLIAGIHLEARKLGHWDETIPEGYDHVFPPKDELPALLPKGPLTPEKRAELAAKYNLRPEDYKPLPNHGDYPDLPYEGANERDPLYDWDNKNLRRNHGEPIHFQMDVLDRLSALDRTPLQNDYYQILRVWAVWITVFGVLWLIGEQFPRYKPIAPKQYPEWYAVDSRFQGNQEAVMFKELKRKPVVNYDFPPSKNDGI